MEHSEAARAYMDACSRDGAQCASELVQALDQNAKVAALGQRAEPLTDKDVICVAGVLRRLGTESALRVLNMEGNAFGIASVQAIMDALEANPHHIRELRLGRNNLNDEALVVLGHALARNGCGLKVLDLSENGITKVGLLPIASALRKPTCDVVELSLHNNRLEADAAPYLSDLMRSSAKLKHLHLGYNALRDAGVAQLAKSLPLSTSLSTLDLTGNRITAEGGAALARALLDPKCTLQRLNLRHNALESDTIALFADVIATNTSLIQLFLGFMNPTPEVAAKVISALRHNRALLLLDLYGWKLPATTLLSLITDVQRDNTCVAAIVTDAAATLAGPIAAGNRTRAERDLHPIYVGADDRDAYLATKSLRRYSRARSRQASRASSRRVSRRSSRHRASSHASARRTSPREDEDGDVRTAPTAALRQSSVNATARETNSASARTRHGTPRVGDKENAAHSPAAAKMNGAGGSHHPTAPARSPSRRRHGADADVDALLAALKDTPCEPKTASAIEAVVRALHSRLCTQQESILALTSLVERLSSRRECRCAATHGDEAGTRPGRDVAVAQHADSAAAVAPPPFARSLSAGLNAEASHGSLGRGLSPIARTTSGHKTPSVPAWQTSPGHRFSSLYFAKRSVSAQSEAEPMASNSLLPRDAPPSLARANDVSGDWKPEEAALQRSAYTQNYPPRIEPSPAQDADPPRRKSMAHFI